MFLLGVIELLLKFSQKTIPYSRNVIGGMVLAIDPVLHVSDPSFNFRSLDMSEGIANLSDRRTESCDLIVEG